MLTGKKIKWGLCFLLTFTLGFAHGQESSQAWEGNDPLARSGGCPFFTLTPNPTSPTCNGFNNGVASVVVSDGIGPFTFAWVGGPSTQTWNNVGAGTYTVIVFDQGQGGAPCNIDVFVNEPGPLSVFGMNATAPTCFGACNGQAAPIVIGGAGGYSYAWDSGETGFTANQLCNPFTLTVTDANGCVLDTTYTFTAEPDEILIAGDTTDITCAGETDGAISLTVEGGVPDYTFSWSGPGGFSSSNQNIEGLTPGQYTVTVTDINGCESNATFQITEPELLEVQAEVVNNPCALDSLGAINLTATGGVPDYIFEWSGPGGFTSSVSNISGLGTGTYNLTLTDANGCEINESYSIDAPPAINIDFFVDQVSCFGQSDGAINAQLSGGAGSFSLGWSGPNGFTSASQNISGLAPGEYTLIATDSSGCSTSETVLLDEPLEVIINAEIIDITCNGVNDGSISVEVEGGTPEYTFAWSGPSGYNSASQNVFNLPPGEYTLVVTDGNDCESEVSFTVNEPDLIVISADITDNFCAGQEVGAIDLSISGGTPPYTYQWTGPDGFTSSEQNISGLAQGNYVVQVIDSSNCVQTELFAVQESNPLELTLTPILLTCPEDDDGAITLNISGGTPDYEVSWTGPDGFSSTNQNISDLSAGVYLAEVTDANGCEASNAVEILALDPLDADLMVTPVSCNGSNDGAVEVIVSGGTPDYTFLWNGPDGFSASSANITGVGPGEYMLTITDANGCVAQFVANVDEPDPILLDGQITEATCNGIEDGAIVLNVEGGVQPYTFVWSGPLGYTSSDQSIFDLLAGNYTVILTDAEGCVVNASFAIDFGEGPQIEAVVTDASCDTNDNGTISASITGGTPSYSIFWVGPDGFSDNTLTITGLSAGTYTLFATDAADCFTEASFTVNNPTGIEIDGTVTDLLCNGDTDGAIDIVLSGPTENITTVWSGPDGFTSTELSIDGLGPGNYTFTVTDSLGCITEELFVITNPTALDLSVLVTPPGCDVPNGQITAVVSGGTVSSGYTYLWTDINSNIIGSDAQLSGLEAGVYTITVADDNGCTTNTTVELSESNIEVDANVIDILCNGDFNGAIEVFVSGGSPPYSLQWQGPDGFTSADASIIDLSAGTYTLTVTDSLNCDFVQAFELTDPEPVTIDLEPVSPPCATDGPGAVVASVSGGTPNYVFNWSGPNGFTSEDQNIVDLEPGTYFLEVTDANGCSGTAQTTISIPQELSLDAELFNLTCFGDSTGAINLTVSGGTPGYSATWSGPDGFSSNSENISNLGAGDYALNIVDANLCTLDTSFTLTEPSQIEVDVAVTPILCFGDEDGEISIQLFGGIPGYAVNWSGPDGFSSNELTLNPTETGDYQLQVVDSVGCEIELTIPYIIPDEIELSINTTQPECLQNNGAISVSVQGGTPPFSYLWEDSDGNTLGSDSAITELNAGQYLLIVTDSNNCESSEWVELSELGGEIIGQIADVTCFGGSNGAITTEVLNATEPLTYAWSTTDGFSANSADIMSLEANTYTLIVTDSLGCIFVEVFEVNQPDSLSVSAEITGISCLGEDGAIAATLSGGTPPYTTLWSGPDGFASDSLNIANLASGTYTLNIEDGQGCLAEFVVELEDLPEIEIDFIVTDIPCAGEPGGQIEAVVTGGSPDYNYAWVGPDGFVSDASTISGINGGFYDLQVTDSNGCTQTSGIFMEEPDPIVITVVATNATCGNTNGLAEAEASGGTISGDYTFIWTDSNNNIIDTISIVQNLGPGTYTLTVTDDNGCEVAETIAISDSDGELLADIVMPTCGAGNDGAIALTVLGATEPLIYDWSGPDGFTSSDQNVFNLIPGTYVVQVTDSLGCVLVDVYELEEPTTVQLEFTVSPITCAGDNNGAIDLSVVGALPPYTVSWTGPDGFTAADTLLLDLAAGTYEVTVIDSLLCVGTGIVNLSEPDSISADFEITNNLCADDTLGSITTNISGGTMPYQFQWIGPNGFESTSQNQGSLLSGFYEVLVTDSVGCTAQFAVEIDSTPAIEADWLAEAPNCYGEADGSIVVEVSGGTPGYSYNWIGPNGFSADSAIINNLTAGIYTFQVTDSLGCSTNLEIELLQPDSLIVDELITNLTCHSEGDGEIAVSTFGGTAPYSYAWTGPNGFDADSEEIENLEAGTYTLQLTDSLGCSFVQQFNVTQPEPLFLEVENITDALCSSDNSGAIDILASGGITPYSFSWTGPNEFTSNSQNLNEILPGTYELLLTDSNGCTANLTAEVDYVFEVEAEAGLDVEFCENEQNDFIIGVPTNADDSWWTDEEGEIVSETDTLTFLLMPGNYTFYYNVNNGLCSAMDSVTVTIFGLPDVDAGGEQTIVEGEEVTLGGSPTSNTATDFLWTPNETLNDSTATNPSGFPEQTATYQVVVTDENGCVNSDFAVVVVVPDIDIPTGVSPNGDGFNDLWIIEHIEQFPGNVVEVYNRWGDQLYRAEGYDNNDPWDGFYNGVELPVGTYYYVIELNDQRFPEPYTGPITIFR